MADVRYLIRRRWLECTEGTSDKFYQPILLQRFEGERETRRLTVGHYGPRKAVARGESFVRPVVGGSVAIYTDRMKYSKLYSEKTAKGYVEIHTELTTEASSAAEFVRVTRELFGSTKAHEILQHFGLDLDAEHVEVPAPSVEPETEISEPDERPPEWGSW
jgi:hypothetical protein